MHLNRQNLRRRFLSVWNELFLARFVRRHSCTLLCLQKKIVPKWNNNNTAHTSVFSHFVGLFQRCNADTHAEYYDIQGKQHRYWRAHALVCVKKCAHERDSIFNGRTVNIQSICASGNVIVVVLCVIFATATDSRMCFVLLSIFCSQIRSFGW